MTAVIEDFSSKLPEIKSMAGLPLPHTQSLKITEHLTIGSVYKVKIAQKLFWYRFGLIDHKIRKVWTQRTEAV